MKKTINNTHLEGYLYENKLEKKVSGTNSKNPGTEYINGSLLIATDDDMTNVIPVYYTYVTEMTAKGKANPTYTTLMSIINGEVKTVMADGKENAAKIRVDSALGLREWYDTRTPEQPLISQRRNEGGFIHFTNELNPPDQRARFDVDILITNTHRIEANEDRNTPEKVTVSGYVFNFRNEILPFDFSVSGNERAMTHFETLGATEQRPVFTRIKGNQVSQTVTRTIEEEGSWGDVHVREVKNSYRDFVIDWKSPVGYSWDSEEGILASELKEKIAQRELHLAEIKRNQEEYQASQSVTPKAGNYDF